MFRPFEGEGVVLIVFSARYWPWVWEKIFRYKIFWGRIFAKNTIFRIFTLKTLVQ